MKEKSRECLDGRVSPEPVGQVFMNDIHGVVEVPENKSGPFRFVGEQRSLLRDKISMIR